MEKAAAYIIGVLEDSKAILPFSPSFISGAFLIVAGTLMDKPVTENNGLLIYFFLQTAFLLAGVQGLIFAIHRELFVIKGKPAVVLSLMLTALSFLVFSYVVIHTSEILTNYNQ